MTDPIITPKLPLKSTAAALIFSVLLGPVGLLYASFWGGVIMLIITTAIFCTKLGFVSFLVWILSSVWAVRAVELYNKKVVKAS